MFAAGDSRSDMLSPPDSDSDDDPGGDHEGDSDSDTDSDMLSPPDSDSGIDDDLQLLFDQLEPGQDDPDTDAGSDDAPDADSDDDKSSNDAAAATSSSKDVIHLVGSDDDAEPPSKRLCEDPPRRRLLDKTMPDTGLSSFTLLTLEQFCVPRIFYFVMAIMHRLDPFWASDPDLVGVEYYSGKGRLTQAFQVLGLRFLPYDINLDSVGNDMITAAGFVVALSLAHRIQIGGLLWQGTVCSSWIWLARATTSRTWLLPRGDENVEAVWKGNIMAARSALLMAWSYSRNVNFVVEQPHSSLLWRHPAMRWVATVASETNKTWHSVSMFMSRFGAKTPNRQCWSPTRLGPLRLRARRLA